MNIYNRMSFTSVIFLLIICFSIFSCKKTSYVTGEPPIFDTTGAVAVGADPPPVEEEGISQYITFDGVSSYVTIPHHTDLNIQDGKSYTITCWVKRNNTSTQYFLWKREGGIGPELAFTTAGGFHMNMSGTNNPGNVGMSVGLPFPQRNLEMDVWHHIAMVLDRSAKKAMLYIDGVLYNSSAEVDISGTSFESNVDLILGRRSPTGVFFQGSMDDVRIWNKALSILELENDMKQFVVDDTTPNLVAAWDFESITGANVPDISGNGHNGTISGAVVLGERAIIK